MSLAATTRRDWPVLRGWCCVPVSWAQVMGGDTFLGPKGTTWHVRKVEQAGDDVRVTACQAETEVTVSKPRDEPVHVLEPSTGVRLAEHLGGVPAVRTKKGQS